MLLIRKEQMDAFQRASDLRWYDERLAEMYPQFASASASQRREWVEQGVGRASAFGLGRLDFLQFLSFEQTFYPGCLDDPDFAWARDVLAGADKDSGERVKLLRHQSIYRLLELEARQEQEAEELLARQDAEAESDDVVPEAAIS